MSTWSDDELLAALGIDLETPEPVGLSAREARILSGWEDIQRFFAQQGRLPQADAGADIFERLYAVRLERLRTLPDACSLLAAHDVHGWLQADAGAGAGAGALSGESAADLSDDALLAALGIDLEAESGDSIEVLRHVRDFEARQAAEQVAQRARCQDFDRFKPLFEAVQADLASGARVSLPFAKDLSIQQGDFFILGGLTAHVATVGAGFRTSTGRPDARLRVIFSNGTESDLLMRSLERALLKDEDGRRISRPEPLPLFATGPETASDGEPDDLPSGTLYVLRSQSDHPLIAQNRELIHKIGITGGDVHRRIAQAAQDATYLLAGVDIVATYRLANIRRSRLERLFHRLFASVRLDIALTDRFGQPVHPREWFLVPLPAIQEAVQRIQDGTITAYGYDPQQGRLVQEQP